jgi:WD40-like Beta Propeller Repeat
MTTNDRFERTMSSWLHEDATFRVPDHLDEVFAVTKVTRQRPAWSSLERWLPVDTTFRPRLFNMPQPGRLALLAGLVLLLLALAIVAIGSRQPRLPEPFGPARNGQYIASRDGDIYLLDPVSKESRLLPVGDGYDFGPGFSRDGTKIVFLRSDGPIGEPAVLTLVVANADGSNPRALTPPTQSLDWLDWSPDSSRVAYMASGQLYVVDLGGGGPRQLVRTGTAHFPTWLPPDGKDIIFRGEGTNPAIFAVAADGSGEPRRLSKTRANNRFDYQSIAVSPDGKHVTFTRWSDQAVPRVYALDVATGQEMVFPTLAGTGQRGSAVYSPDGTHVAYARINPGGSFQLVVANADGSGDERTLGPRQLGPPDGSDISAAWLFTPDGTALIVRYGNDEAGTTHLLPLDGSPGTIVDTGAFQALDIQRLAP